MPEERHSMRTITRQLKIVNAKGIHARPAALFAKRVSRFESDIRVEKEGQVVSGKNVMGLLTLEACCGCTLNVTAEGPDAKEALDELEILIANEFDFD